MQHPLRSTSSSHEPIPLLRESVELRPIVRLVIALALVIA
jgi:hypothetical protein